MFKKFIYKIQSFMDYRKISDVEHPKRKYILNEKKLSKNSDIALLRRGYLKVTSKEIKFFLPKGAVIISNLINDVPNGYCVYIRSTESQGLINRYLKVLELCQKYETDEVGITRANFSKLAQDLFIHDFQNIKGEI